MVGAAGHEDDDREQDPKWRPDRVEPLADSPLFFAFDKLKKEVDNQQVKTPAKELTPVRELFPDKPKTPAELPGVAAFAKEKGFDGPAWLQNFRQNLTQDVPVRATVPVTTSSAVPSRVPVRSTFKAAELASASERALTQSLVPWRQPAKKWDTGASLTPATAMNRAAPEATSPWRRRRIGSSRGPRGIGWDATKFTNYAAAALVGAGAYYLHKRGFGGGGGGTSQSPKFRGGSERGAEWAIP